MNELEMFFYYQKQIENIGQDQELKVNGRLDLMNHFFPAVYCVFEKIEIQRYVFFFILNIACLISEINSNNTDPEALQQINNISSNTKKITKLSKDLHKKLCDVDFRRKPLNTKHMYMMEID